MTMKTFDLKSLLLGVVLTMSIVIVMLLATANSTPAAWEYQVVHGVSVGVLQNRFNTAATGGWEVVGVAMANEHNGAFAVMRRPKAAQRPAWWRFWKK
jgi:hypothetical protein